MDTNSHFPDIKKKLFSSFLTLTFRRALLYAINLIVFGLVLPIKLGPDIMGIFNIGNFIVLFFTYFSDFGLAAAIIQKKDLRDEDLQTTFVIQESVALLITAIIFIAAPFLADYYKIGEQGMWLIRALGIELSLISLKVLPSVLLERDLLFNKLVIVEVLETIIYCGGITLLAFQNLGVMAFTIAVLLRGIAGTSLIYLIAPWRIRLGFSKQSAKELFRFGVPFQANSLLALLKDRLVDLVVAGIIGVRGVSYVSWAQGWAFVPLEVMNIMNRVTFPAFSRLQDDRVQLAEALKVSLFFTALLSYPMLFGLLAVAPSMVKFVMHSDWLPALPLIYLFALNTFWATLSSSFTSVFNAIGKVGITLKLMIMWTVLTWLITPFLSIKFGFMGPALGSALISFSSVVTIIYLKQHIKIDILKAIWSPLICSIVMAVVTYLLATIFVRDLITFIVVVVFGGVFYLLLCYFFMRNKILNEFRELKNG